MKRYSIKINGKVFDVEVEEVRDGAAPAPAQTQAAPAPAAEKHREESADPAPIHRARTPKTPKVKEEAHKTVENVSAGADTLTSPMPGTVLKLCVGVGDEVYAGETLVILEAMKMENEINSPKTGKISMIAVKTGDAVNTGDILLTVE